MTLGGHYPVPRSPLLVDQGHQKLTVEVERVGKGGRDSFPDIQTQSKMDEAGAGGAFAAPTAPGQTLDELIQQVLMVSEKSLDRSVDMKKELRNCRLKPSLFSVLSDIKQRTMLKTMDGEEDENVPDTQLMRLDNMLVAEGVSGPPKEPDASRPDSGAAEHSDYQAMLGQIRSAYSNEIIKYNNSCEEFTQHVKTLLMDQSAFRPITPKEMERMVGIIRKKFSVIQVHIKQNTCEAVMQIKSRFLDARRKRRNFSKAATEILNKYFYENLSNPYPSEDVKEELARKCQISVAQVSNWFGNKRIRYKKQICKAQEDSSMAHSRSLAMIGAPNPTDVYQAAVLGHQAAAAADFMNAYHAPPS